MKRARDARLLGVVAAALLVAGCAISSRPSQTTGQTTTQLKTSTPAVTHSTVTNHPTATAVAPAAAASPCGRGGRPLYRHVIWIWMENHNYESVIGSPKAPYENRLVAQCGSATNYYAITHPSLPNYLAATGGTTAGVRDDGDPSEHPLGNDSIFARLSPLTTQWRTYAETMPRNCAQTAAGLYAVKHNPAAYYLPIRDRCLAWDVPLGTTSVGPLARHSTPRHCPPSRSSCPTSAVTLTIAASASAMPGSVNGSNGTPRAPPTVAPTQRSSLYGTKAWVPCTCHSSWWLPRCGRASGRPVRSLTTRCCARRSKCFGCGRTSGRPRLRRPCAHRSASDQFTSPWRHHRDMTDFPLPGDAQASVVFPAPAPGSGNWVGAPSAAFDDDGSLVLAYRVRTAVQRGSSIVLARSHDGESFTTEVSIEKDRFGAESLERPGIVRTDGRCDLLVSLPFVRRASHQALAHRSARGANGQPTAHR